MVSNGRWLIKISEMYIEVKGIKANKLTNGIKYIHRDHTNKQRRI